MDCAGTIQILIAVTVLTHDKIFLTENKFFMQSINSPKRN
jgi:hypothetical protein